MIATQSCPASFVRFGTLSRRQRIEKHLAKTMTRAFQDAYTNTFESARRHIENQLNAGKKGFVILDIDETTLDNRGFYADPKQYYQQATGRKAITKAWQTWVNSMQIPVIPVAQKFIDWLNVRNVPYVFLTGIRQRLSQSSIQNLKNVGVWGEACLGAFYRPDDFTGDSGAFKHKKRPELVQCFGPVLATIGDQPGDMVEDKTCNFQLPEYARALRRENDQD